MRWKIDGCGFEVVDDLDEGIKFAFFDGGRWEVLFCWGTERDSLHHLIVYG